MQNSLNLQAVLFSIVTPDPGSTIFFNILDNYEQGCPHNIAGFCLQQPGVDLSCAPTVRPAVTPTLDMFVKADLHDTTSCKERKALYSLREKVIT